jgi:cytochrome c oxidase cbb3-type subunit III
VKSATELRMGFGSSSLRSIVALTLVLGVSLPAFPGTRAVPHSGKPAEEQSDLDAGKQLFETSCAGCHGFDAGGGQGPNIQRVPANRGDDAVVKIIKGGVPGTGMPAFGSFTDAQAMQIVAYIRSLASAAIGESGKVVQTQTGDAEKGKLVYASKGCADCHLIRGTGGDRGPELSEIGSLRSADYFRKALQDPGANLPKGAPTGPTTGRWIQYLMFQATTKDGRSVEGMRVSESSIAIVLEDSKGNLHPFLKWDLKSLEKEPGKSFMPSFNGSLSSDDTSNLVAYLVSLKGAK